MFKFEPGSNREEIVSAPQLLVRSAPVEEFSTKMLPAIVVVWPPLVSPTKMVPTVVVPVKVMVRLDAKSTVDKSATASIALGAVPIQLEEVLHVPVAAVDVQVCP